MLKTLVFSSRLITPQSQWCIGFKDTLLYITMDANQGFAWFNNAISVSCDRHETVHVTGQELKLLTRK